MRCSRPFRISQNTVDTQSAVLKTLVEQTNDNVNVMKAAVSELRGTMQQNLAASGAKFDTMSSQSQALSESLDEAKARLSKLGEQLVQIQNTLSTLPAQSNPAPVAPPGTPRHTRSRQMLRLAPPVPDADSLYSQGLSYYKFWRAMGASSPVLQRLSQVLQGYRPRFERSVLTSVSALL